MTRRAGLSIEPCWGRSGAPTGDRRLCQLHLCWLVKFLILWVKIRWNFYQVVWENWQVKCFDQVLWEKLWNVLSSRAHLQTRHCNDSGSEIHMFKLTFHCDYCWNQNLACFFKPPQVLSKPKADSWDIKCNHGRGGGPSLSKSPVVP